MDLHVSLDGRRDLSGQIYRQIRSAVRDGRLRSGQTVPSTRELATRLAVSRNTVATAYDRLVAEGFLAGRASVGTYVSADIPARDDIPSQNFFQHQVVAVTWIYTNGKWLAVADTNVKLPS